MGDDRQPRDAVGQGSGMAFRVWTLVAGLVAFVLLVWLLLV